LNYPAVMHARMQNINTRCCDLFRSHDDRANKKAPRKRDAFRQIGQGNQVG
jgi:hypothetical protein